MAQEERTRETMDSITHAHANLPRLREGQAMKHPVQIAFEKNLKFLNKETYDIKFFQSLFR
mgnify:CR=1 FL=1